MTNIVPETQPKIDISLTHRFGALKVIEGLQLTIRENEFLCICGPSGCGKTTLGQLISGLQPPQTASHVLIDGRPADPKVQDISFVFQEPSCMPWLTVRQNVEVPLRVKKVAKGQRQEQTDEMLRLVGLYDYADYFPGQISGGMKQRIAIARAFVTHSDVIIMDEPFVSLDAPTRARMQAELLSLWEHKRRTVVFITHSQEEAVLLADRVVVLSSKPTHIKDEVTVSLPRPRDVLAPEFIKLRARLASSTEGSVL